MSGDEAGRKSTNIEEQPFCLRLDSLSVEQANNSAHIISRAKFFVSGEISQESMINFSVREFL